MELFGTTGQERRAWLDGIDAQINEALRYYLGPTGIDKKVNALAQVAPMFMDGTDVQDAQSANDRFWADPSVPNALAIAAPMAALAVPGVSNRLAQGMADTGADVIDAGRRFVTDEYGGLSLPGGETAAQTVARMLRDGRAGEVTDDMMAAVDPQEMHDLYVRGATGADMPMDAASRMARAGSMGFDTGAFHATDADFVAFNNSKLGHVTKGNATDFDEGSWANNLAMVGHWTNEKPLAKTLIADVDMPLMLRGDFSEATSLDHLSDKINEAGGVDAFRRGYDGQRGGFSGVSMPDEEVGGLSRVMFSPHDMRSRFARFDPRLSHLRNLSASAIPLIYGANALAMDDEKQQIRDYLGGM